MERLVTFAVVGDSAASGVGDTDLNGVNRGWGYYLAKHFVDPLIYVNVSRPGAQSLEVLEEQLPKILIHEPDITAVIVGGNDALRNGFSVEKIRKNLDEILSQLRRCGSEILLLELHDPSQVAPLPKTLGSILSRRIDSVNSVTRSLAKKHGAQILNVRELDDIYDRKVWHIDRMHPSKFGHQLLAINFRSILVRLGWRIDSIQIEISPKVSRRDSILWMLRNGTPWFFKRSFDLLPSMLLLMAMEITQSIFAGESTNAAQLIHPDFYAQSDSKFLEVFEERVS